MSEKEIKKTSKPASKKAAPEKVKKAEKKADASKLPALFKKSYKPKDFEKQILKKLYVASDKEYVKSLFKTSKDKKGNEVLAVSAGAEFTKAELKRLKTLAKEIKANKGRFKAAPFIAVASVIAVVGITVTVFKNPVAKMAIRSTMQGIFGAKCDISSVNVEILGAQLTVNNLAQASSDDEFKNVFEFEKLDLNFNLANLLRGRFHAENIEITGIALGTERKESGKLPVKPKSAKEKAEKNDSTGFYASVKAKTGNDPEKAKKAITDLFAMYDPNAITENVKDNLQSQKTAKEVEEELKAIVEKWKNKPEELKKSVEDAQNAAKSLTSLNVSKVNAAEIPGLLKQIESALSAVQSSKKEMESSLSSYSADQKRVNELKKKLNDAVAADKKLLSDAVSVLDVSKAKEAVSDALNQAGYGLLGQYYPYLKQLISYAGSMKGSGDSKEAEEANKKAVEKAKKESRRFPGRYVFWKTDRVPKFLIEKAHGSGNGLEILATNISSDMNKRGEPWIIKGNYAQEKRLHNALLTVDARENTSAPLIAGKYSGNNFPLTLDLGKASGADCVPKFEGNSVVEAELTADEDYSFSGLARVNMNPAKVSAGELGSETASRIYSSALSSINSLDAKAKFAFSEKDGIDLAITTDFDRLLAGAVSKIAEKETAAVKEKALSSLSGQLGSSEGAQKYLSEFSGISSQLDGQKSSLDLINKQLDSKKSELTKKAASSAGNKAASAVSGAAGSFLKKF